MHLLAETRSRNAIAVVERVPFRTRRTNEGSSLLRVFLAVTGSDADDRFAPPEDGRSSACKAQTHPCPGSWSDAPILLRHACSVLVGPVAPSLVSFESIAQLHAPLRALILSR